MIGIYKSEQLSNNEYHSSNGFFSSSQFKDAASDIEFFYKKYIAKELVDNFHIPAFDIGTYYHTAILEPQNLNKECAVFTGKKRLGKVWEAFKQEHEGKAIITQKEYLQADNLITATKNSEVAMDLISEGVPEMSLFVNLHGLPVKVRADWIDLDRGFIMDLKSTTGNAKDTHKIKNKIASMNYDLSAALYLDAFNVYLKENDMPLLKTFYWVFASKDYCNCKTYAASPDMLEVGRRKYQFALRQILKYQALGWEFPDEIETLSPLPWEKDVWMGEKEDTKKFETNKPKVRQVNDGDLL